ncbi:hypothetical protein [Hymenobacter latericus]|uniref:hypothetical protein n=1 Tax=Hymenobacter sp. YIM 151858-1 TaxID=2987688 RepID=UPI002226986F|nr:hypothetical protein [Hymenobacter sp. YIM 151858-1]UYZ60087.1 hypothetical protein OIS50_04625 [Hymenobacter sp. YIM 151858-1]
MQRSLEFEKLKDGRLKVCIADLDCFTPPVPKDKSGFLNGHVKSRKDQRWERDFPTDEELDLLSEKEYLDLQAREADRIFNGCWFLNDGEPTYLTGVHYTFLTHFQLPSGEYADFREADQKDFLHDEAAFNDPQCIGKIFLGARQRGKTARRACRLFWRAITDMGIRLGIQSKNDESAQDVLNKFVSHALRNLSRLIRPVTDLATDNAQKKINFKAPARRGKTALNSPKVIALNTTIERRNSKPQAFDGDTLAEWLGDEWAKKQDYDSEERFNVVSRMMRRGGKAIGFCWLPSTIDEKEDFEPDMPLRMWKDADPTKRKTTGSTENGLVRLFVPAYEGHIIDAYGRSLIRESIADLEANCPSDPVQAQRYWRANPRDVNDAFATAGRDSIFNVDVLRAVEKKINHELDPHIVQQVDLVWTDHTRTAVKTSPNKENGRFKLVMRALPPEQNNVVQAGYMQNEQGQTVPTFKPLNDHRYAVGCDPYDARTVAKLSTASKGAAYVLWKPDMLHEQERLGADGVERGGYWPSDSFIVEYINRPPRPQDFYEDMVKLCHFFGCSLLPERQKPGIIHYFENRGYKAFIGGQVALTDTDRKKLAKKKDADNYGHAASTEATVQWSELMAIYSHGPLADDWRRMPFAAQVKDWLSLDVLDTQKYDAAVASGWTLMQARRFVRRSGRPLPPADVFNLRNFFNV